MIYLGQLKQSNIYNQIHKKNVFYVFDTTYKHNSHHFMFVLTFEIKNLQTSEKDVNFDFFQTIIINNNTKT